MREQLYIIAKGGGGGGGGARSSGGGFKSSAPKSSSTPKAGGAAKTTQRGNTNKSSTPKSSTPKAGKSTAKPGSKIKTADGKEVQSSTKKPSNSKYTREKGIIGDNGYNKKFNNYSAPAGSVVYYPQHSALDYLPWIYLFSQNNSPHNQQATVVQPDGKEVQAKPVQEGVDGMYILNWLFLIIIVVGICVGIVYLVNKLSKRGEVNAGI